MLVRRIGVMLFDLHELLGKSCNSLFCQIVGDHLSILSPVFVLKLASLPVLMYLFTVSEASGAELTIRPYILAKLGYHDNVQLTVQDPRNVRSETKLGGADLMLRERSWSVGMGSQVSRIIFFPDDIISRTNVASRINSSYKTELSDWKFIGVIKDETVLVTEELDTEVLDPDTALVNDDRQRVTKRANPSVKWSPTERIELKWSYLFRDISYDETANVVNLFNYRSHANSIEMNYRVSTNNRLIALVESSNFKSERINPGIPDIFGSISGGTESQTRNYQIGLGYSINETLSGKLTGGYRETLSDRTTIFCSVFSGSTCLSATSVIDPIEETGSTYSGQINKILRTGNINLEFSRDINPSSGGDEVVTDTVSLVLRHSWSYRLDSTLSIVSIQTETVGEDIRGFGRRVVIIEPKIAWYQNGRRSGQFGWYSNISYRITRLKRITENEPVRGDTLYFAVGYRWKKTDLS